MSSDKPIQKGQLVWKFDLRIDIHILLEELVNFPSAVRKFLRHLTYVKSLKGKEVHGVYGDNAKHKNHDEAPNMIDAEDNLYEYAARDLVGEEPICNYHISNLLVEDNIGSPSNP